MRWSLLLLVGCTPFSAPELGPLEVERSGARGPDVVRVATWNIETVGDPGTAEYDAALSILTRLDADVVSINEIADAWDEPNAAALAEQAGYDWVIMGEQLFGSDRNAVFSRLPLIGADVLTAPVISGDSRANDITRAFVTVTVDTGGGPLEVVSMHWKSGWDDSDELRRVFESRRAAQLVHDSHPQVFAGDWNDDLRDGADWPVSFDWLPSGTPSSFWVGFDLWAELQGPGLANDPFQPLLDAGLDILDARQRSGTDLTRPVSGRRLDYIAVNTQVEVIDTEVYDCRDEGLPGLSYPGAPVESWVCGQAADHLPVVADIRMASASVPADELGPGDLVITEVLPNPEDCSDDTGEWIEIRNTTSVPVDLSGLEVRDASGHVGVVTGRTLEAGGIAVLGRGDTPCGIDADGVYAQSVSLNNGGDTIELVAGQVIDGFVYASAPAGRSWVIDGDGACLSMPTPGAADTGCP